MLWSITAYTEMGKAMDQVAKVARDLIKARRESGHTEKVSLIYRIIPKISALRKYKPPPLFDFQVLAQVCLPRL